MVVGDEDDGNVLENLGLDQAFVERKLAGVEEDLLAVQLEQQAGVDVFGDAHGVGKGRLLDKYAPLAGTFPIGSVAQPAVGH
ncbi:hypothetical protein GCM10027175_41920 [Hymenobacter latericoloratus]